MKTAELTGAALDWAVAKCEGVDPEAARLFHDEGYYNYSTDWSQAGPIIEREGITVSTGFTAPSRPDSWTACVSNCGQNMQDGPTPLVAAMRCFVASKLGDTVDIPEELT